VFLYVIKTAFDYIIPFSHVIIHLTRLPLAPRQMTWPMRIMHRLLHPLLLSLCFTLLQ